jgi:hypothetical protein
MVKLQLPEDFKDFLRLLNSHNIASLLIGGYAVGYQGYPRATGDMDIWIAMHPENAIKMVEVLRNFGFDVPELSADMFLKEGHVIRMGYSPIRIEILTTISGVKFDECYAARVVDQINGIEINLISLEHLKQNKKACNRHKDLDDLQNLP